MKYFLIADLNATSRTNNMVYISNEGNLRKVLKNQFSINDDSLNTVCTMCKYLDCGDTYAYKNLTVFVLDSEVTALGTTFDSTIVFVDGEARAVFSDYVTYCGGLFAEDIGINRGSFENVLNAASYNTYNSATITSSCGYAYRIQAFRINQTHIYFS